jgi:diacylglycerol O-acyltransferase / wax synthase
MDRLSTLDSSFLRVETPSAHMHVGWLSRLRLPRGASALDAELVEARIASRLHLAPRFRQVVRPLPVGEPAWSDHHDFDLCWHIRIVPGRLGDAELRELCDEFLSRQLDRSRPLWEILVVPELEGGRAAVAGKVHHAMVDGIAAVELGTLLFDGSPDVTATEVRSWEPEPAAAGMRVAVDAVTDSALDQFRAARRVASLGLAPGRTASVAQTMRRAALSIAEDALNPAPASYLNRRLGPGRTLVTADLPLARLHALKRRLDVKLNDVVLALATGALRRFAATMDESPHALRAMVPVSVRRDGEAAGGNRITFAFVELPCNEPSAIRRLSLIHSQTQELKRSGRVDGSEAILRSTSVLPGFLKDRAARLAASPRLYNLTVSNVPGPGAPLFAAGAMVEDIFPVIPLADQHLLSIGVLSYRERLQLAAYADPGGLPEVGELAGLFATALGELERAPRHGAPRRRNAQRGSVGARIL